MRPLEAKHYVLLAGFLTALAAQVAGLQDWAAATKPVFIAGVIGQIAVVLGSLYAGAPGATGQLIDRRHDEPSPAPLGQIKDPTRLDPPGDH